MRAGDIGRQVRPHGYGSRAGGVSDSGVVLGAEIPHYYEMDTGFMGVGIYHVMQWQKLPRRSCVWPHNLMIR